MVRVQRDTVTIQLMRPSHAQTKRPTNQSPKWDDKKALKVLYHLRRTGLATNNMLIITKHFLLLRPFEINKYKQPAFNPHLR